MKFTFPYHDRDAARHEIEVEAETFDEAVDLAVRELWRRTADEA